MNEDHRFLTWCNEEVSCKYVEDTWSGTANVIQQLSEKADEVMRNKKSLSDMLSDIKYLVPYVQMKQKLNNNMWVHKTRKNKKSWNCT